MNTSFFPQGRSRFYKKRRLAAYLKFLKARGLRLSKPVPFTQALSRAQREISARTLTLKPEQYFPSLATQWVSWIKQQVLKH